MCKAAQRVGGQQPIAEGDSIRRDRICQYGLANLAVKIEHDLLRRRQQAAHTTIEEEAAALTV